MDSMSSGVFQVLAVGFLLAASICHAHDAFGNQISAEPLTGDYETKTSAMGFFTLVSRQFSSEQDDPEYDHRYEGEGKFVSGVMLGCETSKPFFCGKRCFKGKKAVKKLHYKKVPDHYVCGYESPTYAPPSQPYQQTVMPTIPAQQVYPEMTGPPPLPSPIVAPSYAQPGNKGYASDYHVSVSVGRQQQSVDGYGYGHGGQPYPEHIPKYCPRYKNVPFYKVVYLPVKKCEKWFCEKTKCKRKIKPQPEEVKYDDGEV